MLFAVVRMYKTVLRNAFASLQSHFVVLEIHFAVVRGLFSVCNTPRITTKPTFRTMTSFCNDARRNCLKQWTTKMTYRRII